jgi:hypothetical protein
MLRPFKFRIQPLGDFMRNRLDQLQRNLKMRLLAFIAPVTEKNAKCNSSDERAWQQGYDAWMSGWHCNPYPKGSEQHVSWASGYENADWYAGRAL